MVKKILKRCFKNLVFKGFKKKLVFIGKKMFLKNKCLKLGFLKKFLKNSIFLSFFKRGLNSKGLNIGMISCEVTPLWQPFATRS